MTQTRRDRILGWVQKFVPADMVPYRYSDAQPTKWLWASEGITDYYTNVALVRGGVTDSSRFYDAIANELTYDEWWSEVQRASGSTWFHDFRRRYVDGRGP